MAKDPAFLFYPGDWLGGTLLFDRSHKGAYMDLLMVQFNSGHMLIEDIKMTLGNDYETMWESKLKSKFKQDSDGKWYNVRLDFEKNKRINYTKSRGKNLKKDDMDSSYASSYEIHMDHHMNLQKNSMDEDKSENKGENGENGGFNTQNSSYASSYEIHMDHHMENENENENINRKGGVGEKPKWAENFKNFNPEIKYAFESEKFGAMWDYWIKYKRERKDKKYTTTGEQATIKGLYDKAEGSIDNADEIINQSIQQNWAGLFEVKDHQNKSQVTDLAKTGRVLN